MRVFMNKELRRFRLASASSHCHRFGRRRCLIQKRSISDWQSSQIRNHRLKIQKRFEAALTNFGLVRRVRRVPRRILEHIAANDRGSNGAGVTHTDQTAARAIH